MFGDKVPEVAYKKGVDDGEVPHVSTVNPSSRRPSKKVFFAAGIASAIVIIALVIITYYAINKSGEPSPEQMRVWGEFGCSKVFTEKTWNVCKLVPTDCPVWK